MKDAEKIVFDSEVVICTIRGLKEIEKNLNSYKTTEDVKQYS